MRRSAVLVTVGILGGTALALSAGCGGGDVSVPADPADATAVVAEAADGMPVIESLRLEPREPSRDDTLRAVTTARDPGGQSLQLGHRWYVDGVPQQGDGPTLALSGVRKGGEVRVVVTASDGVRDSVPAEASATVIDRVPTLTAVSLSPETSAAPGQPVSARVMAADPDGDLLDFEYVWYVNGSPVEASGAMLATEGLSQGDVIHAEIRASDGRNWTRSKRTAGVTIGSAHPTITSTPPGFREDGFFRYVVVAEDPDGDRRLRYALLEGPEGMAVDSVLGELVWHPRDDQQGVHPVSIEVRDSTGLSTTQSFHVTVRLDEGSPPAAAAETGR